MMHIINRKMRILFVILIIILAWPLHAASAQEDDTSDLRERLLSFDDPRITVQDLAFFLLTHNYDAKPMKGYVELNLNGKMYKLIPNGDEPGLCDILPANSIP